jgi:hypothetical protein
LRNFARNQIFSSDQFPVFLKQLWVNSDNYNGPAVFESKMTVMDNPWFSIKGREIGLLLIHYGPYRPFIDKLDVSITQNREFNDFMAKNKNDLNNNTGDNPVHAMYPNYVITETHMPPIMLNLLAHFTCTVAMTQEAAIKNMFS